MQTHEQGDTPEITEEILMELADSMAAAAVSFSAHGYDEFIRARELFKNTNRCLFGRYANRSFVRLAD